MHRWRLRRHTLVLTGNEVFPQTGHYCVGPNSTSTRNERSTLGFERINDRLVLGCVQSGWIHSDCLAYATRWTYFSSLESWKRDVPRVFFRPLVLVFGICCTYSRQAKFSPRCCWLLIGKMMHADEFSVRAGGVSLSRPLWEQHSSKANNILTA